jgi:hypothetical protein
LVIFRHYLSTADECHDLKSVAVVENGFMMMPSRDHLEIQLDGNVRLRDAQ